MILYIIVCMIFLTSTFVFYLVIKNNLKNRKKKNPVIKQKKEKIKFIKLLDNPASKQIKSFKLVFAIIVFLIFTVLIKNIIFSAILGIGTFVVIGKLLKKRLNKKMVVFENQLIEAFGTIAYSVKSGQSLLQAMENMVSTSASPISDEFSEVLRQVKLGSSLDKALLNLTQRMKSKDLKMAVTSINLAKETGGNIGEILMRISHTIRDRKRLKGKVEAMTTQGKTSGMVIGFMPFGMLGLLYLIEPDIFGLMFTTMYGNIMLGFVVVFVFIGMQFINKIVDIKL